MAPRLPLHLSRRQPQGSGSDSDQFATDNVPWGTLARGKVDFCGVGTLPWHSPYFGSARRTANGPSTQVGLPVVDVPSGHRRVGSFPLYRFPHGGGVAL